MPLGRCRPLRRQGRDLTSAVRIRLRRRWLLAGRHESDQQNAEVEQSHRVVSDRGRVLQPLVGVECVGHRVSADCQSAFQQSVHRSRRLTKRRSARQCSGVCSNGSTPVTAFATSMMTEMWPRRSGLLDLVRAGGGTASSVAHCGGRAAREENCDGWPRLATNSNMRLKCWASPRSGLSQAVAFYEHRDRRPNQREIRNGGRLRTGFACGMKCVLGSFWPWALPVSTILRVTSSIWSVVGHSFGVPTLQSRKPGARHDSPRSPEVFDSGGRRVRTAGARRLGSPIPPEGIGRRIRHVVVQRSGRKPRWRAGDDPTARPSASATCSATV